MKNCSKNLIDSNNLSKNYNWNFLNFKFYKYMQIKEAFPFMIVLLTDHDFGRTSNKVFHGVICLTKLGCGSYLGWQARMPDVILVEDHIKTIPLKFGYN